MWLSLLLYLLAFSLFVQADGSNLVSLHAIESANDTAVFDIEKPEDGFLTAYYQNGPTQLTVRMFSRYDVYNMTVEVVSSNTDVATVTDSAAVKPCKRNSNLTSIDFTPTNITGPISVVYSNATAVSAGSCYELIFNCTAEYIGYSTITFTGNFLLDGVEVEVVVGSLSLRALRPRRAIDVIFLVIVYSMVGLATLGMGNGLCLQTIKKHLKKPKAPIIALVSQFTFMPLLSYGVVHLLGLKGGWALGFFAMGCSPGGGSSNIYSKLFDGDMSVSITMTTLSTLASIGMMPFWLYTLGSTLPADEEVGRIPIPFVSILTSFATLVVPLSIGLLIKYKLPRLSKIIKKSLKVFFILLVVFFLTFGIYANLYIFYGFKADLVLASSLLPYGGFIFGAALAWVCRLDWKLIKTVSIETGLQNVGLSIIIIKSVMDEPDSDLAIIPPIAANMMTPLPLYIILPVYLIRKRILRKREERKDAQEAKRLKTRELADGEAVDEQTDVEMKLMTN